MFKSTNVKPWPGSQPSISSADTTVYNASDDNAAGDNGDYFDTTTIVVTDGSGNSMQDTNDPEIENQGSVIRVSPVAAVGVQRAGGVCEHDGVRRFIVIT